MIFNMTSPQIGGGSTTYLDGCEAHGFELEEADGNYTFDYHTPNIRGALIVDDNGDYFCALRGSTNPLELPIGKYYQSMIEDCQTCLFHTSLFPGEFDTDNAWLLWLEDSTPVSIVIFTK